MLNNTQNNTGPALSVVLLTPYWWEY